MPEPIIIAEPDLLNPPDGRFWLHDEQFTRDHKDLLVKGDRKGRIVPNFSVQETAKFFFGRSSDWLRWRYESDDVRDEEGSIIKPGRHPNGFFVLDGVPLEPKKAPSGYRYYTLADIERMAHALAQNGVLDGTELSMVIQLVKLVSQIWKRR